LLQKTLLLKENLFCSPVVAGVQLLLLFLLFLTDGDFLFYLVLTYNIFVNALRALRVSIDFATIND